VKPFFVLNFNLQKGDRRERDCFIDSCARNKYDWKYETGKEADERRKLEHDAFRACLHLIEVMWRGEERLQLQL